MILRKTEIVTKEIAVDQGPDHVPRKVGIKTEIDLETDPETDLEKGRKGRDHERERSLGPDLVRNIRKVTKETDTAEIGPDQNLQKIKTVIVKKIKKNPKRKNQMTSR